MSHTMLVATELTTEDMLDILTAIARKVTYQRDEALKDAAQWKREFEMYRGAWLREMGSKLINKHHDIDAFVLTTRWLYERAMKWEAQEEAKRLQELDAFWDVPDLEKGKPHGN